MTENTAGAAQSKPEDDDQDQPDTETPREDSGAQNGAEESKDQDQFPRAYVEELREEAKALRLQAQRADDLEQRLRLVAITAATRGVLVDATALTWSDDYNDDDGMPDVGKITDAARALADARPYLAQPRGIRGLGEHSSSSGEPSLSALLRG